MRPITLQQALEASYTLGKRTHLQAILESILVERQLQDKEYGPASERGYSWYQWVTVLTEEVGEVAEAVQGLPLPVRDHLEAWVHLYTELMHVSAVAVAMAETMLADARKEGEVHPDADDLPTP